MRLTFASRARRERSRGRIPHHAVVGCVLARTEELDARRMAGRLIGMSRYRRWREPGGTYFFTVVTFDRRPILTGVAARRCLREAFRQTRSKRPFEQLAVVLLPDHLHCLWRLPCGDKDFSTRWRLIKTYFTRSVLHAGFRLTSQGPSRQKRQEHTIWQRRFWEHWIRDERDLKRHVDYIHYNPVKHGHVRCAADWPYSTFAKYVALGEYPPDWGQAEPDTIKGWEAIHD